MILDGSLIKAHISDYAHVLVNLYVINIYCTHIAHPYNVDLKMHTFC